MPFSISPYREALASRELRRALLVGSLIRGPLFASGVILTLHVVQTLGGSYAAAGVLASVSTLAVAVSGPIRGRLLDRLGVRRVVAPCLLVGLLCWSIAPFVPYWPLLTLAALAGLFVVPVFSVSRQWVIASVGAEARKTAIALDSAVVELSFMAAPVLAIAATTAWSTRWVLLGTQLLGVAAGVLLWVLDPPIVEEVDDDQAQAEAAEATTGARFGWVNRAFVGVCLAAAASAIVLFGSDLAFVAAMRTFDQTAHLGFVLALWGAGSLVGGLVYGGLHRSMSPFTLLAGLALVTLPLALAQGPVSLGALGFLAGLLCAPTLTATIDRATRVVPVRVRGEALGWHGSCVTGGGALGAPIAGYAIDHGGYAAGVTTVSAIGLVVAVIGVLLVRRGQSPAVAE